MKNKTFKVSRRSFLSHSSKATLMLGIGSSAIGSAFLTACGEGGSGDDDRPSLSTGFDQTSLGYDYSALEPHIDAMTMEIHYTKHAAAYANNLGEAASEEGVDVGKPLEEVMMNISKYSTKMRNNGGGHYNHELFWKIMSPNGGGEPSGDLRQAIDGAFGSYDEFKTQFEDAAKGRFGSGWGWLVLDKDNLLKIGSTPNQDNPLMDVSDFQGIPLMGIDVWEHAYYLNYQNRRPDYVSAFWNIVNWDAVAERYNVLVQG
ncbi:Manganese superoxide dismutase [Indibacter alkaliphilus LW1]|jgi:Fe-Mn family superoxide dismutase|uniref:Superoxide dismutase n=1 Tax=Indibacter alkaliphilus (strain CCUG 57479 / KCTC 22604 / LW1) TaxID=1189612 RepID=S2DAQ0_INDAL|nr:superoxide dismutase [Indibacter alkaliphilus]EOZ95989.1 Manganese superoxide dismutase [Indibacter alkaliphilus LW1]